MANSLGDDLLIILAMGFVAAVACRRLRVSLIVGYLFAGILVGKGGFHWVHDGRHELEMVAEMGVFFLLFSIGLEFSLDDLWKLGRNLLIGGSLQMLLVALPTGFVLLQAGLSREAAILIAAAVSFSSTVLVFKAFSEQGQSHLPHGRRAIGILLFQDAALIPLLLIVPLLTQSGQEPEFLDYLKLGLVSVVFLFSVLGLRFALARSIIPALSRHRIPELVILFTLVCLGGITLAAYRIGLPPAVGAFAAGLILNGNRWTHQIDALILPFRETFAAVFFVSLGLLFNPRFVWEEPTLFGASFLGVILLKTIAAVIALKLTSLPWRTAFGTGVGLAHVGEFAFVLMLIGLTNGIVSESQYQRVVAVGIASVVLAPLLLNWGLRSIHTVGDDESVPAKRSHALVAGEQALVVGAGPIGRQIASRLEITGSDVCLIDLSPLNLQEFAQQGFRTVAGDATDRLILETAHAQEARLAIVCVPGDEAALQIVRGIRSLNSAAPILVRCRYQANAAMLKKTGANEVVSEESIASTALIQILHEIENHTSRPQQS